MAAGQAWAAVLPGLVLGAGAQLWQPALWPTGAYGLLAALALLPGAWCIAGLRRGWRHAWLPGLLAVALLAFALTGLRACAYAAGGLEPALEGRDLALTGTVAAMPQSNEMGTRFVFDVDGATAGGSVVAVPRRLSLAWYAGGPVAMAATGDLQRAAPELRPGQRWAFTARLRVPHGQRNPHGFDLELWLWEHGLQATGTVRAGVRDPAPRLLAQGWSHPLERARHAVREAIFARVADRRLAGVLAALVVGDQGAIERADWDVFRATGVAHLMSISGLHVTMFAWAAALAVGAAWRRSARLCLAWPAQHAALVGGLLLAAAYAAFSGWGVPAQRTVWMLATVAALRLSGHTWPWPWTLLLACAVVTTLDPWALTQPGFWLSFVAVGVLFAAHAGPRPGEQGWGGRALGLLREQWVVTVALTPLSLLLFGQVSLVGLLANLAAIPWVTLVVTPLALAGVLVAPAWDLAAHAVAALAWALQGLAALPFATVDVAMAPLWVGAAGLVGGLLLAMRLPPWLRALGLPLLLPVLLWQAPRPPPGEFDLLAADVGQGNAVLVRTAAHTLVYDAGPRYGRDSDAGHRVLVPLLRAWGERVDTLVVSHRDADHAGGAAAVLGMQKQAAFLSSIEAGHELQALRPVQRCLAGQAWEWDGVRFEVLHPREDDYAARLPSNHLSCVLRVGNGRATVLLPGDAEQPQEARLVGDGTALRADLLLVPHHGSRTSSSEAFLDAVQPRVALVQAGWRNRFGHPAAAVVARYQARGALLVESGRCGAAHWRSTAPGTVRCERDAGRRYWHHGPPP